MLNLDESCLLHAKLHFSRVKGLSSADQDILLENTCTHRDIHVQIQDFLKLERGGVVGFKKKVIACVVLHAWCYMRGVACVVLHAWCCMRGVACVVLHAWCCMH